MSSVSIGENIKISLFGESHGFAIGGVIDVYYKVATFVIPVITII